MIKIHVSGFPRIGAQRELKFALERYWQGDLDAAGLEQCGRELRARHWQRQREAGLDWVTVGDFAFYDLVANHVLMLGCAPARFDFHDDTSELQRYFTLARGTTHDAGHAGDCTCQPQQALELTKWFDTNYHYLVPEFDQNTTFKLDARRLLGEIAEAQALGHPVKVSLLGPLTFLWLGKSRPHTADRLQLLDQLVPVYRQLLGGLAAAGVTWVELAEPILGLDLPVNWSAAFERAYFSLNGCGVSILLSTWFAPLQEHLSLACRLPVAGLHVDLIRAGHELVSILDWLPPHRELSLGLVDGRNIWRCDLDSALTAAENALARRGRVWLAPSCSLLHVPLRLRDDSGLDPELRGWLAGAEEKLDELATLRRGLLEGRAAIADELDAAAACRQQRATSTRVHLPQVAQRLRSAEASQDQRSSPYAIRRVVQQQRLQLPAWPTTTIGSFPQTADIRRQRAALRRGELDEAAYTHRMHEEIRRAIAEQEALGLDVLVHGEPERNDMVEYFGEQLQGFAFSANGWVQSYGSRCVKPPILYGDVCRPQPMTVEWSVFAQGQSERPVKGMLTGPITLLQWSFVRDDQPRRTTALQLALALRDEVLDLEAAGLAIIQIDEPALREGLPLRHGARAEYLRWAGQAFRVAASGVRDETQIHTHMCYAEFGDILSHIASLDADVITLEASRSDMELLHDFAGFAYPNAIGPGVYDIHSPQVPTVTAIVGRLRKAARVIGSEQLWVNPDCGLKTRGWPETRAALAQMVAAARALRAEANA